MGYSGGALSEGGIEAPLEHRVQHQFWGHFEKFVILDNLKAESQLVAAGLQASTGKWMYRSIAAEWMAVRECRPSLT